MKRIFIKQVGTKSSKVSVCTSGFVSKSFPGIQTLLMNTNIIIPVLYFF